MKTIKSFTPNSFILTSQNLTIPPEIGMEVPDDSVVVGGVIEFEYLCTAEFDPNDLPPTEAGAIPSTTGGGAAFISDPSGVLGDDIGHGPYAGGIAISHTVETPELSGHDEEIDLSFLVECQPLNMFYVGEDAGYNNVIGIYTIDENGDPTNNVEVLIDNQHLLELGTHLATVTECETKGMFIIANGADKIDENSVITFDNSSILPVILVDGQPISNPVYHNNPYFNYDGTDHFVFTPDGSGGSYIFVEDLPGGGDNDYNDIVMWADKVLPDTGPAECQDPQDISQVFADISVDLPLDMTDFIVPEPDVS